MASTVAASRKHVELSLELKRKLIQEHEHGVPFTLLGKKYHIATSTAANIWRKKDFFLRSRMSGSRKRCNDRSKYKIVNQVTALFVKSMLERNHKIDGEVIKRFARTAAAQCNFKDFHGSNGWLDSFKKRENVCWVRRRGERIPGGHQMGAASGDPNGSGSLAVSQLQLLATRSDSPNLSAAAAAAALAASAAAQQNHHHSADRDQQAPNGSPQPHQLWPDTTEPAMISSSSSSLSSSQQQTQHRRQVQQMSAALETGGCPRCNVAAAAAAVAALNSSDSIHERDHEIEDWFHGIPFLCQFFEEYQSMHQAVDQATAHEPSNGAASSSTATSSISSTASSSSIQLAPAMTLATSTTTTCTSSSSTGEPAPLGPTRSVSDAHELMDSCLAMAGAPMRISASMADLQSDSCGSQAVQQLQRAISTDMLDSQQQQQQYEMSYEPPGAAFSSHHHQQQQPDYPMAISSSSTSDQHQQAVDQEHNNGEHLMEIAFAEEQQLNEANHQCQMELMIKGDCCNHTTTLQCGNTCTRAGSEASIVSQQDKQFCHQNAGQQNDGQQSSNSSLIVCQCDYNSDDQEFYLTNSRYIPQDAQSDDLLYHDEDHNDCCSDHYEPNPNTATSSRELHSLHDHYQADLSGSNSGCYIDEYEYENISTIRHYPVPNMSLQQQQVSPEGRGFAQRQQQQQPLQSANSVDDTTFMSQPMANRPPVELDGNQSFMANPGQLDPNVTGEYPHHEQSQQQQQPLQSANSVDDTTFMSQPMANRPPVELDGNQSFMANPGQLDPNVTGEYPHHERSQQQQPQQQQQQPQQQLQQEQRVYSCWI